MMIRQACMRKMCEIEERIVVAQEKGRAGLIDVRTYISPTFHHIHTDT